MLIFIGKLVYFLVFSKSVNINISVAMVDLMIKPVHEYKNFLEGCVTVLNEEWPRSKTARLHMLEKSDDKLPYSIAFVDRGNGIEDVIGHSRLSKVHNMHKACFIESVVIRKDRRGQGLGRTLMEMTEIEAKRLGFRLAFLTTRDKQNFYHHLGYEYCDPIITLGSASSLLTDEHFQCLFGTSKPCTATSSSAADSNQTNAREQDNEKEHCGKSETETGETKSSSCTDTTSVSPSVPCPPPVPKIFSSAVDNTVLQYKGTVYWMKKTL